MTNVSRRDAFQSIVKAGAFMAGVSQLGSKAKAAGRHSDPFYCPPICFVSGTFIDLRRGPTPIEEVRIGDEVRTHRGDWTKVKWIGRMPRAKHEGASWAHVQKPVLFRCGSLDDNVPNRDLYVSQQHAMLVNDVLIPAKYLLNGSSIAIVTPQASAIDYVQIECEQHEAIYAHGAASETFYATELRPRFANHAEYVELYGAEPERLMMPYRPILRRSSLGSKVAAIAISVLAAVGIDIGDPVQRARAQLKRRARGLPAEARVEIASPDGRRAFS